MIGKKRSKVEPFKSEVDFGDHFVPRKIPSQNVAFRLIMRELNGSSGKSIGRDNRGIGVSTTRGFFLNVFPNYTLVNVEKPPCFLRKFTPDGKYFIAFSPCQTHLEVYLFLGPAAGGHLVHECTKTQKNNQSDFLGNEETSENNNLRNNIFKTFFRQVACVSLAHNGEQLNRECSLFSECGRKVIVGSASYNNDDGHPPLHDIYRNNESVSPNPRNPLENYTLYSVDLVDGLLCDSIKFKTDKIFLSHNQGIYLYRNVLAVLSVQHQTIHIFRFDSDDGRFLPILQIGRILHDTDEYLLSMTGQSMGQQTTSLPGNRSVYRNYREGVINQLKHRILVFLYRRSVALSEQDGNLFELRKFYQFFDQIKGLRIWKMQLLDEEHILIKYASEEVVTLRSSEPNAQMSLFVVYNMKSTEVKAVYDNTSEELLDLFENFCDFFRNTNFRSDGHGQGHQVTSSPSNNIHANLIQQRFKQTIVSAKNGGLTEARKRVLAQLPISAQSYTATPYLDLSLFSYDEKWVSVMERPKACGEHAIQFYGRDCGLLKFKIYAGVQGRHPPPSARRLVAFIFHPTDPFAISVQRTNLEYVVNFHVRKPPQT